MSHSHLYLPCLTGLFLPALPHLQELGSLKKCTSEKHVGETRRVIGKRGDDEGSDGGLHGQEEK
jgi:hypothetical protein